MKKLLVGTVCGLAFATAAFAENAAEIGSVRLKGYLGERLDALIERHVDGADVDYITAPFVEKTERKGWWQTEFWGKWMHSAVPYAAYADSEILRTKIERGIDRILASQESSGYIGNYPDELRCGEGWDVWGMEYTLLGLIHYYDLVREEVKVKGEGEQWNDLRLAAVRTAEDIAKEEVNLAGGCACSEAWFHGAKKQHRPYVRLQETCVTTACFLSPKSIPIVIQLFTVCSPNCLEQPTMG